MTIDDLIPMFGRWVDDLRLGGFHQPRRLSIWWQLLSNGFLACSSERLPLWCMMMTHYDDDGRRLIIGIVDTRLVDASQMN
jgi:hypothetical protein